MGSISSEDGSSFASFLRFVGGTAAKESSDSTASPDASSYSSFLKFMGSPNKSTLLQVTKSSDVPSSVTVAATKGGVTFFAPSADEELESGLKPASNPSEDADEFLKAAFAKADADSSGEISRDELKVLLLELGLKISDKDLDQWFEQIDTDNSGEISFEEFVSIFKSEKQNNVLESTLREIFQSYDADGSGCIDCDELRLLMAQLGHDISEAVAKDMISQADQDGNGEIDFDEFVAMFKGVKVDDKGGVVRGKNNKLSTVKYGRQASLTSILEESVTIFDDAKKLIPIDSVFRFVMWVYSNRVLVLLAAVHFVATMIIWSHFAVIKWQQQENNVPIGAPRYWAKRIIPPLEFGSMHAILFQMALIPLTMARYTIASMSGSKLNHYLPLNKALRVHIHLGYTMVSIVFLATLVFFTFFGLLCSEGEEAFCAKFTTEIMITGYCILVMLLLMAGTAFFRHTIPYEVFYAVHFLFLVMYSLAIAHTIDAAQRSGKKERSQTFKWFVIPLLFYFCDYTMMYVNQRFETKVTEFTAVEGNDGSKMIILKMRRPTLFRFKPGQYAFLRCKNVDRTWHPFSIASAPKSNTIEFYIEVFDEGWTEQLWNQLKNGSRRGIIIDLMGPYGTSLIREPVYTNLISIGTGTGIVPCISLLKQHVKAMLMMEPEEFLASLKEEEAEQMRIHNAEEKKEGTLCQHISSLLRKNNGHTNSIVLQRNTSSILRSSQQQQNIHDIMALTASSEVHSKVNFRLKLAVLKATKDIYGKIIIAIYTLYAVTVFGLTISWTTTSAEISNDVITGLEISTLVLHAIFFICSFFIWDGVSLQAYVDATAAVINPFADWYFHSYFKQEGSLGASEVILLSLLNGYIVIRMYQKTLDAIGHSGPNQTARRLQFVWSVRTAKMARQIFPEIEETYQSLIDEWGFEDVQNVLSIRIHITEKNKEEAAKLRAEIRNSTLFKTKQVFFIRPKLDEILEDHQTELIESHNYSSTLIAFCGGPQVSRILAEEKTKLELYLAALGYSNHSLDFISESYGGPKSGKQTGESFGRPVESTPMNLWDLVKQETTTVVNSKRVKQVFSEDNKSKKPSLSREFASRREMLEYHRKTGNSLRFRSNRAMTK